MFSFTFFTAKIFCLYVYTCIYAKKINIFFLRKCFIFISFKFFLSSDKNMEFQFVFPDGTFTQTPDIPSYSLIHQGNMNDVPLTVIQGNQDPTKNPPKWPVLPMLQYSSIETVDSMLPKIQLSDLG